MGIRMTALSYHLSQGQKNLHRLEGNADGVPLVTLDQAELFQPAYVGVKVGVVAVRGLGQRVHAAGANLAKRAQKVHPLRRQIGEQRTG